MRSYTPLFSIYTYTIVGSEFRFDGSFLLVAYSFFLHTMTDQKEYWLEKIDPDRSTPGDYVLNGKDRLYCATGKSQGSFKKSELRSRIKQDRVQALPKRFQDLFDDIALLQQSDEVFFADGEKAELWKELVDVENHASTTLGFDIEFTESANDEFEFGVGLGAILRSLKSIDYSESHEADLIWGLIIGLCGWPTEVYETEAERIDGLISKLEKKRKSRTEDLEERITQREILRISLDEYRNRIVEVLNDNGIEVDEVPFPVGPTTKVSIPPEKQEMEETLPEIINLNQLKKTVELSNIVESDGNHIRNKGWRGEEAEPIVEELWWQSANRSGDTIRVENMNSVSNNQPGTSLINKYSYSSGGTNECLTHYTLIEQTNHGRKLTEYGKLVSYCLFSEKRHNLNYNWITKYRLSNLREPIYGVSTKLSDQERSLIQNVINEVGADLIK